MKKMIRAILFIVRFPMQMNDFNNCIVCYFREPQVYAQQVSRFVRCVYVSLETYHF